MYRFRIKAFNAENIIMREINMMNIQSIEFLKNLIITVDESKKFSKKNKKKYEDNFIIQNVKTFINTKDRYAGKYYSYNSQDFWIGYSESFNFSISFRILDESVKKKLITEELELRQSNKTYIFEFVDINKGEIWLTIPLAVLLKIKIGNTSSSQQSEIFEIIQILNDVIQKEEKLSGYLQIMQQTY